MQTEKIYLQKQDERSQGENCTNTYDFVIIGSGFGGSVSAMRLAEKGYKVIVLEKGKRFRDEDFPKTNWNIWKYLWLPFLRCYGIQQITLLNDVMIYHGSGVGGGSLVYANVLMEPDDKLFEAPAWSHLADWKNTLQPYYATAKKMLGVTKNPCQWPADITLKEIAEEMGQGYTFQPTDVGVFFGDSDKEGQLVSDPYFNGQGPPRRGCINCGGCMVGCRHNAKNTLVKNYLYFAEKWGVKIKAESEVMDIRPLPVGQHDEARYEIAYRKSTAWLFKPTTTIRTRHVIVSAGTTGTLKLLFKCRDANRSLPNISSVLGNNVRTNSESIPGVITRNKQTNYSLGIAITSLFHPDEATAVEPVRYPEGSSFMRFLSVPLVSIREKGFLKRVLQVNLVNFRNLRQNIYAKFFSNWARYSTILLVMQNTNNLMKFRLGRNFFTLFREGLVAQHDPQNRIQAEIPISHRVTRLFAEKVNGIPAGPYNEIILNIPSTAHILGGVPFGKNAGEGVIGLDCQVHNYPGLYVIDGSIMPANPGINPSLTITAIAEYAMDQISPKNTNPNAKTVPDRFPHLAE